MEGSPEEKLMMKVKKNERLLNMHLSLFTRTIAITGILGSVYIISNITTQSSLIDRLNPNLFKPKQFVTSHPAQNDGIKLKYTATDDEIYLCNLEENASIYSYSYVKEGREVLNWPVLLVFKDDPRVTTSPLPSMAATVWCYGNTMYGAFALVAYAEEVTIFDMTDYITTLQKDSADLDDLEGTIVAPKLTVSTF